MQAASKANVNDEIAAAMDELTLDCVRAIKALVKNLKSHHLDLDLRWTNADGFIRSGRMDRTHAGLVQEALELAERGRTEYEESGELRGIIALGKNRTVPNFEVQRFERYGCGCQRCCSYEQRLLHR